MNFKRFGTVFVGLTLFATSFAMGFGFLSAISAEAHPAVECCTVNSIKYKAGHCTEPNKTGYVATAELCPAFGVNKGGCGCN